MSAINFHWTQHASDFEKKSTAFFFNFHFDRIFFSNDRLTNGNRIFFFYVSFSTGQTFCLLFGSPWICLFRFVRCWNMGKCQHMILLFATQFSYIIKSQISLIRYRVLILYIVTYRAASNTRSRHVSVSLPLFCGCSWTWLTADLFVMQFITSNITMGHLIEHQHGLRNVQLYKYTELAIPWNKCKSYDLLLYFM